MTAKRFHLAMGMEVVGADGKRVGQIKEVRDHDFLVDRELRRDLYLPFHAIGDVQENRVILTATEDDVAHLASVNPPITSGPGETYRHDE